MSTQTKNVDIKMFSTGSRGRTGTAITGHRILSPACLPIPPFLHLFYTTTNTPFLTGIFFTIFNAKLLGKVLIGAKN